MIDYYKILKVSKNSSIEEIKKSFRDLSKKYHPDLNKDLKEDDKKEYVKIIEAYSILSNKEKRKKYDNLLCSKNETKIFDFFKTENGIFDIYQNVFFRNDNKKNEDLIIEINLSIEEYYYGCTKEIKFKRNIKCQECEEERNKSMKVCHSCNGLGKKIINFCEEDILDSDFCDECYGSGLISDYFYCKKCDGNGFYKSKEFIKIEIKPGTNKNHKFKVKEFGNYCPFLGYGDLLIKISEILQSKDIKVSNFDIIINKEIELKDFLECEFLEIKLFKNRNIKIKKPNIIGKPIFLKNKGVLGLGDLIINIFVRITEERK